MKDKLLTIKLTAPRDCSQEPAAAYMQGAEAMRRACVAAIGTQKPDKPKKTFLGKPSD